LAPTQDTLPPLSPAERSMLQVRQIYISPGHNFFGRHGKPAGAHPSLAVDEVECIAGSGLKGDRFFSHGPDYKGQVTFFSEEILEGLREHFNLPAMAGSVLRRNVITSGEDLNTLIGRRFALQGVAFEATEECRPCYWMDQAVAPGAEAWLRGRGGVRCRILSDGRLKRDAP